MSYDLKPRNKKIDGIRIGTFSWPMYLQLTGMGYLFGYGESMNPAEYVYQTRGKDLSSPVSNDGFRVTSDEAKIMAKIARGYISVNRWIQKEWEKFPEEEQERRKAINAFDGKYTFKKPLHSDHLDKLEIFAEFAENSGGFTIN